MPDAPGSREQVEQLLDRIDTVDVHTNAVCTIHPDALGQAEARDEEAAEGRSRGPLHGVPVLVKDNIDTHDLTTTAGSLALADVPNPSQDAELVRRMREAGMVVLGKTNLSEWANIRDGMSTSGWSAYGGLTRNPYGLNRSAGGSSSGSGAAVAAGLARFAIGTETDGSITCPAAFNGVVGIKPTVGLVPTDGVVPVARSQDAPGPMATTVRDAAALLTVLAGDGTDYASHAVDGRLAGKRIGVPRKIYWGYSPHADAAAERAVGLLAAEGAEIVDGADLTSMEDVGWEDELLVLLAELRSGLGDYLATRPGDVPRSLEEVVAFNRDHADRELEYFGQSLFDQALAGPAVGSQEYVAARARCLRGRPRRGHRRRSPRARSRRAGHPVVRTGRADRPGQRRAPPRRVHAADGDGGIPARDGALGTGRRAAGRGVVLGHGRERGDADRDRARLRVRA